jgi:hypothetical protein
VVVLADPENVERVQALMEAIEGPAKDPRKQVVLRAERQGIQTAPVPGVQPFRFVRLSDSIAFKEAVFFKSWALAEVPVRRELEEFQAPVMLSTNDIRLVYLLSEAMLRAMQASPARRVLPASAGLNLNDLRRG